MAAGDLFHCVIWKHDGSTEAVPLKTLQDIDPFLLSHGTKAMSKTGRYFAHTLIAFKEYNPSPKSVGFPYIHLAISVFNKKVFFLCVAISCLQTRRSPYTHSQYSSLKESFQYAPIFEQPVTFPMLKKSYLHIAAKFDPVLSRLSESRWYAPIFQLQWGAGPICAYLQWAPVTNSAYYWVWAYFPRNTVYGQENSWSIQRFDLPN